MKPDGDEFSGGDILDPESGSVYHCKMHLEQDGCPAHRPRLHRLLAARPISDLATAELTPSRAALRATGARSRRPRNDGGAASVVQMPRQHRDDQRDAEQQRYQTKIQVLRRSR